MIPLVEIGNSLLKISLFLIERNRVRVLIKIFNFIKICLFFKNKVEDINNNTDLVEYKSCISIVESHEPFKAQYTEYKKKVNLQTDIKTIAWYLPQFHTFKENDEWWGKDFTEWTNVKKSKPLYEGHYQPRIPHSDLGYYDLSDINVMKKQIDIAKNYGLYGFCFYHYDFAGKRLMEKPVDNFVQDKNIDFNFCLSFANENWTRAWDGLNDHILIKQNYSKKDDLRFIQSLQKYFDDDRYIKIDGKPVFLVYRPLLFPDINATTERWRNYQKQKTGKDLFLIFTRSFSKPIEDAQYYGFDIYTDFSIHSSINSNKVNTQPLTNSYKSFVENITNITPQNIRYKDLFLMWDNSPRKKNNSYILENFNLHSYRKWLQYNIEYTRNNFEQDKRLMFINAWNEWGEGTYLEPDTANGYTFLDILADELNINKRI